MCTTRVQCLCCRLGVANGLALCVKSQGRHRPVGEPLGGHGARQLFVDFGVCQLLQEFADGSNARFIDEDRSLAMVLGGPSIGICLTSDAAEIIMGSGPDQIELRGTRHVGSIGVGLLADRGPKDLDATRVAQIAVTVKPSVPATDFDFEEMGGNAPGLELGKREGASAHEKRRENLEHVIVGIALDFEPLVLISLPGDPVFQRAFRNTVEQLEHLLMGRGAVDHLLRDWRKGHGLHLGIKKGKRVFGGAKEELAGTVQLIAISA